MQILEGDLLKKMNSSRKKREIKGRKNEREQEKTRDKRTKERTRAGRNMPRDVFRMQASKAISVHKIIE